MFVRPFFPRRRKVWTNIAEVRRFAFTTNRALSLSPSLFRKRASACNFDRTRVFSLVRARAVAAAAKLARGNLGIVRSSPAFGQGPARCTAAFIGTLTAEVN